jgi:hypothetical protein
MKKKITIALILLFAGVSLFAQKPHHKNDKHKEIKKEYKRHHNHRDNNKTVIIQPSAPSPLSVEIQVSSPPPPPPPRQPSIEIQLPSPPPPPRPPR